MFWKFTDLFLNQVFFNFSVQNGCSGINRCENVGRRLANQQSLKNRVGSVKTGLLFSPDIDERLTKKGKDTFTW